MPGYSFLFAVKLVLLLLEARRASDSCPGEQDDDEEPQPGGLPVIDLRLNQLQLLEQNAVPEQLKDPAEEEERCDSPTCDNTTQQFHKNLPSISQSFNRM